MREHDSSRITEQPVAGRRLAQTGARAFLLLLVLSSSAIISSAQTTAARPTRVSVLDFGETETGLRSAERLSQTLSSEKGLHVLDRDESRAAALGTGYRGSLNMTLEEARDLGASTGADFFITGDAQTLRRSPSTGPVYYESYASIFLVSSRTGRLIMWERPSFQAPSPAEALEQLLKELAAPAMSSIIKRSIRRAEEDEAQMRRIALERAEPAIESAPDDASGMQGLKLPLPYRRLRPPYPETAARAEAEATVDVQVDIGTDGEVSRVEVVRWAGFGLDEATVNTVRQMHFRPAMRDGEAIPMRVLLRYNFRKPPIEDRTQE